MLQVPFSYVFFFFFFRPEIEDKDNETLATTVLTVVTSEGVLVQNTEDDMRKCGQQ